MDDALQGQITRTAAEIYEEFFVPALFAEWAPRLVKAAGVGAGHHVLDVACGTGVFAAAAAARVGAGGAVTGLDRNEGMLAVARRKTAKIEWRQGRAEALPFADAAFDAVGCQFALMFFEDRSAALREMWRVVKPGGRVAIAVWAALPGSPGYAAMTALLQRLFGDRVADALRAPFCLGDPAALRGLLAEAGLAAPTIETIAGTAQFPSIDAWVRTDIKGWTLAEMIDDAQYATLLAESRRELAPFVGADGRVAFAAPAHIATARKG